MTLDVPCLTTPDALERAAADLVMEIASEAVRVRGVCRLALAGGSTPRGLYERLAESPYRERLPWSALDVFWSDERAVGPSQRDSNYRMAFDALLSKVPLPPERVHRMRGEAANLGEAAGSYDAEIRAAFPDATGTPRFDLLLLGIGADGHTASLFPGTPALAENSALVVANPVPRLATTRLTMTLPLINAARTVLVLAAGADKADAVRSILQPHEGAALAPAALVHPHHGRMVWLLDTAAAGLLAQVTP